MAGMKLDAVDLRILLEIQREGRITKLALAERVGLSPTPCWTRLRRLEKAGIISGNGRGHHQTHDFHGTSPANPQRSPERESPQEILSRCLQSVRANSRTFPEWEALFLLKPKESGSTREN